MLNDNDLKYLRHAINLAAKAREAGNLPIGAVIVLEDKIIGEGRNSIWKPRYRPNRHAEIEALESVRESELWSKAAEMTLYTTLEPCLMCVGTILVHRVGRIVYGSNDPHGGAICVFKHMPQAFENLRERTEWIGPALPQECDPLSAEVIKLAKSHKQESWGLTIWDVVADEKPNPKKVQQYKNSLKKY